MSVNPVLAALAGLLLLGQVLALHEWTGILVVVAANVVAVLFARTEQVEERAQTEAALDAAAQTRHPAGVVGCGGAVDAARGGACAARRCPPGSGAR